MRSPEDYAATKIQAEIRGFLARKHIRDMKKESDKAATRIQSNIRFVRFDTSPSSNGKNHRDFPGSIDERDRESLTDI